MCSEKASSYIQPSNSLLKQDPTEEIKATICDEICGVETVEYCDSCILNKIKSVEVEG